LTVSLLFVCVVGIRIATLTKVAKLDLGQHAYTSLQEIAYLSLQERSVSAIILLFSVLAQLQFIMNRWLKVRIYVDALVKLGEEILAFLVLYGLSMFAFTTAFYLAFGQTVQGFQTLWDTFSSLFTLTLGSFNYETLVQSNRVLGPFLFYTYAILMSIILINFLIAILSFTFTGVYETAKNEAEEDVAKAKESSSKGSDIELKVKKVKKDVEWEDTKKESFEQIQKLTEEVRELKSTMHLLVEQLGTLNEKKKNENKEAEIKSDN